MMARLAHPTQWGDLGWPPKAFHLLSHSLRKVCRHFHDLLSHHLVQCWWERHHKGRCPEDYFFPYLAKGMWKWDAPMSNEQHNKAVQACAAFHKLGEAAQFTSTAIRTDFLIRWDAGCQNHLVGCFLVLASHLVDAKL